MTSEEQQHVFGLRENRDNRRGVAAVTPAAGGNNPAGGGTRDEGAITTVPTTNRAVGAIMSRRDQGGRGDTAGR